MAKPNLERMDEQLQLAKQLRREIDSNTPVLEDEANRLRDWFTRLDGADCSDTHAVLAERCFNALSWADNTSIHESENPTCRFVGGKLDGFYPLVGAFMASYYRDVQLHAKWDRAITTADHFWQGVKDGH